ncbi:MAG TPA: flagellar basal body-associated FliL family protein [Candidatus Acidoferrum sp.]|jgi:flagellar FliL protein
MSDEKSKAVSPGAQGGVKKSSKSATLSVVFLLLGSAGGAAWMFLQRGSATEASRGIASSGAPKYLIHLEGFTVNLADPEDTHFLRVTMDLGIDRLPQGAEKEKTSSAIPVARVRDSILAVLTVCRADVLLTSTGKSQLKKNLVEALQRDVPELGVREVYFTEFLVQR